MGPLMVLVNQVFPCFHLIKKTSPTHNINITQIILRRNTYWASISTVTILKKVPKAEFEYFLYQKKVCEEFLII